MDDLGLFASILGHNWGWNFHESIMYDRTVPGEREKVERCVKNMVHRALEMEGTCTVSLLLRVFQSMGADSDRESMELGLGRKKLC